MASISTTAGEVPEKPATSTTTAAAPDDGAAGHSRKLLGAAALVGFMTVLSRILGLWRFRLLGGIFGASDVADAFNFAFIFPNLTRRLFGEGAMTSAFVPVFSDRLAKNQHEAANKTGSVLICRLTWWLTLGCVAIIALAGVVRLLVPRFVPGQEQQATLLLIQLFQWMLPYLVFINVACVLMGILNSMGHFLMPAFAPVLLNVAMIGACLYSLPFFGTTPEQQIWAVAYAVLIGGAAQLIVQFPPAFARGFRFSFSFDTSDPGYQEVINNFKPVVLLIAVFQANVMMDNIIAKYLIAGDGPVTYLNMGTSVYQMPWSIFSLALGTVLLPALAKQWALEKKEDFYKTLLSGLRMAVFLLLPCTIGIVLLSDDLVRLLYGTGRFLENDAEPVRRTAGVVMYSTLGLVFFGVNSILARALYATKDMKTPTTTSAQSVAINLGLNLFFVIGGHFLTKAVFKEATTVEHPWYVQLVLNGALGLGQMREGGIALASTLSNAWQTWMLAKALRARVGIETKPEESTGAFLKMAGWAAVFSCALGFGVYEWFSHQKDWEGFYGFFAAAGFGFTPFVILCREYFVKRLESKPKEQNPTPQDRLGVKEEHWSEELRFQHSLYTSMLASAIMGFVVWAMRDSLPPEGRNIWLVAQRALIPVAAGIAVYMMAASGLVAREYDELKSLLALRFGKKTS
jgi:putative peptidoglycan lipid II flippase